MKQAEFPPETLAHYEIFAGLTPEQIKAFWDCLEINNYSDGETIIQEGAVGNSILILIEGEVEITQALTLRTTTSSVDTREKSILRLSDKKHPFFGEMSLFSNDDRRTATVKAVGLCKIARLGKEDFFNICNNNPAIGNRVMQNIARVLCQRLKQANQNVLKLTTAFSLLIES